MSDNQAVTSAPATERPDQFLCILVAAPFFVGEAVTPEVVALEMALGLLLWSLDSGMMDRPWMMFPWESLTVWDTAVLVTETILPVGAFAMPLSIRVWAPGGTAGRVKLLLKDFAEMSEAEHFGAVTEVFCAGRPCNAVTFRVLNCFCKVS